MYSIAINFVEYSKISSHFLDSKMVSLTAFRPPQATVLPLGFRGGAFPRWYSPGIPSRCSRRIRSAEIFRVFPLQQMCAARLAVVCVPHDGGRYSGTRQFGLVCTERINM